MTQKNTIRTEVIGNDTNRYLLKIEWNKTAPSALVIMLQASKTNGISFDRSTNYCLSNLTRLRYGSVSIVNLFSNLKGEIGVAVLLFSTRTRQTGNITIHLQYHL